MYVCDCEKSRLEPTSPKTVTILYKRAIPFSHNEGNNVQKLRHNLFISVVAEQNSGQNLQTHKVYIRQRVPSIAVYFGPAIRRLQTESMSALIGKHGGDIFVSDR